MPRITDEQYKQALIDAAKEFNKRASWIDELPNEHEGFLITTVGTKNSLKGQVDLRDLYAMSSMLPLRGETEEERKKNFKDDVYKMANALVNGPKEETYKYVDMVFNMNMNFDEDALDYSKPEDVFKAVSCASLGQCFGTKREEFPERFNEFVNTPEKKEKFYYANAHTSYVSGQIYDHVSRLVRLNNGVTINSFNIHFDQYTDAIKKNVVDRDIKQYENSKKGDNTVVPFEFKVNPEYKAALDLSKNAETIMKNMNIYASLEVAFSDLFVPGGTEGKKDLDNYHFNWKKALFINGVSVEEAYKNSRFANEKTTLEKRMDAFIIECLTNPDIDIEMCKFIPVAKNEYKKVFIPIHRDYSDYDKNLQAKHDAKYNSFVNERSAGYKAKEVSYLDKEYQNVREQLFADNLYHVIDKMPNLPNIGERQTWNTHDSFIADSNFSNESYDRLNRLYNALNKYNAGMRQLNPGYDELKDCTTIEVRQGNAMALLMSSEYANEADVIRKRYEIHRAIMAGGEERRKIYLEYIEKLHNFDYKHIDINSENGLYKFVVFINAANTITNMLEEEPELREYINRNIELRNDISQKGQFSLYASEFVGSKLIEKFGSIPQGMFSTTNLSNEMYGDILGMNTTETRRLFYDLGSARLAALYKNEKECTLTIPYYMSGNACGSEGDHYSNSSSKTSVEDYLAICGNENNDFALPQTNLRNAGINSLTMASSNQMYGYLRAVYACNADDTVTEYATANGMDIHDSDQMVDECTYIDNKSLSVLLEEKRAELAQSRHVNYDALDRRGKNQFDNSAKVAILAQALADPDKVITQVFFDRDKNNCVVPKAVVMNKNYDAMVKNAENQHGFFGKLFHSMHLYTYAEEKVRNRAALKIQEYKSQGKDEAIVQSFTETHKEQLLKHQGDYAIGNELRREALRQVNPEKLAALEAQDKMINDIRKDFAQEKVNVKSGSREAEYTTKAELDKLSGFVKGEVAMQDNKYADNIEKERFERKFYKDEELDKKTELDNGEVENMSYEDEDEKDFDLEKIVKEDYDM